AIVTAPERAELVATATRSLPTATAKVTMRPTATPRTPPPTELAVATPDVVPPEPATLDKLRLTMPAGWMIRPGSTRLTVRSAGGAICSIQELTVELKPGAELFVTRPVMVGTDVHLHTGFTIAGTTFGALVASIGGGVPDARRSSLRVGGALGYRWSVPQLSYVGPLVSIAAIKWRGRPHCFLGGTPPPPPP